MLPISFYRESNSTFISECVTALGASFCLDQEGDPHLFSQYWAYPKASTPINLNTQFILDSDVDTYDIQQTTSNIYDSISITIYEPFLTSQTQLYHTEVLQTLLNGQTFSCNTDYLFSIDSFITSNTENIFSSFAWHYDTAGTLIWDGASASIESATIYGTCVQFSEKLVCDIEGIQPYDLSSHYIQTVEWGTSLLQQLTAYFSLPNRVISFSLPGCTDFWPGVPFKLISNLYHINTVVYTIADLSFHYNGSVSTDITAQRVI